MATIDVAMESTSQEILSKVSGGMGEPIYQPSDNLLETVLDAELSLVRQQYYYCLLGIYMPTKTGMCKIKYRHKTTGASSGGFYAVSQYMEPQNVSLKILNDAYALSQGATLRDNSTNFMSYGIGLTVSNNTDYVEYETMMQVVKGMPLFFFMDGGTVADNIVYCDSIKIYADEVN